MRTKAQPPTTPMAVSDSISSRAKRAPVTEAGIEVEMVSPSSLRLTPPHVSSGIATPEAWEEVLGAIKSRLRVTMEQWSTSAVPRSSKHGLAEPEALPLSVSDAIAALDRLAITMKQDLGRRQQLEQEVFDAQAALAQARAQLAGTQAKERRARHLALHDSLTALPNRSCFRDRLDRALYQAARQQRPLALLYLDLDGFKPINDTYGHAAGDELLKIVASRLTRAVRTEDLVSRLGGDEFACLVAGFPSMTQLSHLACKLFDAVAAPCKLRLLRLVVQPSIGIAIFPADGTTAELLLDRADAAMYRAKRHQIGVAFFDQSVDA